MKKYCFILFSIVVAMSQAFAAPTVKYNKELDGFAYPFEVKTFDFNSQNKMLKMRYMDIGDKNAKKTIVLLHGKNFAGYYWESVANDLLNNNYRVIIPDQIGFGKSSKPDYYQYSFGQLALNTKLLLDSLHINKADIVGHSMGGMVATTYTANYADKVNKLILINPIGLEAYGKYTEFKDVNFFYKNELGKTLDKARDYQKKNYYDGKWSEEYEKLLIPLKGMLAGDDWQTVAWNNALTYGPIFSENIVDRFSQIKNDTVIIIGTRDTTGPGRGWMKAGETRKLGNFKQLGVDTQNRIAGSTLIELEGLGHMPHYEDYDAFIKAFHQALDK
ncbi:alpha/beta hydrolase [Colwellia sp. 1_MG-2023]|uniref:alpha/beta fold hydrolase n=1 Tax=unclassified Colwellia TaxID=196834 RepID=UPI001C08B52F|nr:MULTISPECIES: alpha/beta hydrolase [unclassified Colwellia]MBU2926037.1 alpha/beta hydrolase [Colwellia sp. C2M11]MDO6653178.1 alpha/beta hydrolase [Colwellia sp. 3_MG-2023]MDO6666069.1 alpha/beta hydrolase [Colwellia sp. 2_MG-2023]MDO6690445.1 alpha/beta hydrolase [Colwellia sp. 1_MG-2023]